jgi:hypothetical protein
MPGMSLLRYLARKALRPVAAARHAPLDQEVIRKFWAHVKREGSCWVWTGSCTAAGNPQLNVTADGKGQRFSARRISWEITFGPLNDRLVLILDGCVNQRCVSPRHLCAVTRQARAKRICAVRVPASGQHHGMAKLSAAAVAEIRARYGSGETTQRALSVEFGVSETHIRRILCGKNWKTNSEEA